MLVVLTATIGHDGVHAAVAACAISKGFLAQMLPDFTLEDALPQSRIAGVDEAGRGPWAGPVTAAAVILDPACIPKGLNDSKQLTLAQREALFPQICETAVWSLGWASVDEIDEMNILNASHLAMERAVNGLEEKAEALLIDGNRAPKSLEQSVQTVIKGDAKSLSIAAASILAKVARDRHMVELAQTFPDYGWHTNRGYGTKAHQMSLLRNGVTPHHRRSFKPIHNILYQEVSITD